MIEVLAVLAIVGVLSAVGISGYRYAVVKIETNNLVNELNTCSAIITTATIYHPDEDPDIDECLGGDLDKYDIEVSEIYTYEGETEKYFEFTLHHVSDEVLAELLHMDPPFISQIKVNGEVVEDGEVVSYHKPLFIKSAYAGGDNTVQIEVPVSGLTDPFDDSEWAKRGCESTGGTWNSGTCTCSGTDQYCRALGFSGCITSAGCTVGSKRCSGRQIEACVNSTTGSFCPTTEWSPVYPLCGACQDCVNGSCQDKSDKEKCECEGNGETDFVTGLPNKTGKTFCSSGNCCESDQYCVNGSCLDCPEGQTWFE